MSSLAQTLAATSPWLADRWAQYEASPAFVDDAPYAHLGQIAVLAIDALRAERLDDLRALFDEVETRIATSSRAVRKELVVGLLEDLQNSSLNGAVKLERWHRFLGPSTLEGWRLVEQLWAGSISPSEFNRLVDP